MARKEETPNHSEMGRKSKGSYSERSYGEINK